MGKGDNTTTQNTSGNQTQTTTWNIPQNVRDAWTNALNMAGNAAGTPFQPYQGIPVAPFAPDTLQGFDMLRNIADNPSPLEDQLLNSASSLLQTTQGGGLPTNQDIQGLMNPYTQNVTDIGLENLQEQYDVMRQQLYGNKALAGSFGGARHGVQEGELQRGFLRNAMELSYGGQQDAYDRAIDAWFRGQGQSTNSLNTALGVNNTLRDQQVANASNLTNIGQQYQQNAQSALDFGVGEFGRGVQYPFDTANFFSNIAYGYPWQSSPNTTNGSYNSTTTTTTPGPSPFEQILGAGMGIASLWNPMSSMFGAIGGLGGSGVSVPTNSSPWWGIGLRKEGGRISPLERYAEGGGVSYDMTPGWRNVGRGDDNLNITYSDGAYAFGDPRVQELWQIQQAGRHEDPMAWMQSRRERGTYEDLFQNLQLMQLIGGAGPSPIEAAAASAMPTDAGAGADSIGDPNGWINSVFGGQENLDYFLNTFGAENPGNFGIPEGAFGHNTPLGTIAYNPYINQLYGQSPYAEEHYGDIYAPGGWNDLQAQRSDWMSNFLGGMPNPQGGGGQPLSLPGLGGDTWNERRVARQARRENGAAGRFADRFAWNQRAYAQGGGVDWGNPPIDYYSGSSQNSGFYGDALGNLTANPTQYAMTRGNRGMPIAYGARGPLQRFSRGRGSGLGQSMSLQNTQYVTPEGQLTPQQRTDMLRAADPNWNDPEQAMTPPADATQITQPGFVSPIEGGMNQDFGWQGMNLNFGQNQMGGMFGKGQGQGQGQGFGRPSRFASGGRVAKYANAGSVEVGGAPVAFNPYEETPAGPTPVGGWQGDIADPTQNLGPLARLAYQATEVPGQIGQGLSNIGDYIGMRMEPYQQGLQAAGDFLGTPFEVMGQMSGMADALSGPGLQPPSRRAEEERSPMEDYVSEVLSPDNQTGLRAADTDRLPSSGDPLEEAAMAILENPREPTDADVNDPNKRSLSDWLSEYLLNNTLLHAGILMATEGAGESMDYLANANERDYQRGRDKQGDQRYNQEYEENRRRWEAEFGLEQQRLEAQRARWAQEREEAMMRPARENWETIENAYTEALTDPNAMGAFYYLVSTRTPPERLAETLMHYGMYSQEIEALNPPGTPPEQFAARFSDFIFQGMANRYGAQ